MTRREAFSSVLCLDTTSELRQFIQENKINFENQDGSVLIHCRTEFEEECVIEVCSVLGIECIEFNES